MRKQQAIQLSIPQPCHENWETMTAKEKGRHCDNCNKTVVDFSLYSDKELVEYFKTVNNNVCGHLYSFQLNRVLAISEPSRNSFFKKLFLGTALASWLGLAESSDAQNVTPHPVNQQNTSTKSNPLRGEIKATPDTSKNYINLSFFDAASKQAIQGVNITIEAKDTTLYYSSENSTYKLPIRNSLIGEALKIEISSSYYETREIVVNTRQLPLSKKIYLDYQKHHVMVNGGMVAHPVQNDK